MAGRKDISKLVRKVITNTKGHKQTVYVKVDGGLKSAMSKINTLKDKKYKCSTFGECVKAADEVTDILDKHGIDYKVIEGYVQTNKEHGENHKYRKDLNHTWVELKNGKKIDVTISQFDKEGGIREYLGKDTELPPKNVWSKKEYQEIKKKEKFNDWFKGSKVVDKDGKPLIVYHGTKEKFDKFSPEKMNWQTIMSQQGAGYYFTDNEKQAKGYGKPMKMYLSIKNPFILPKYNSRQITRKQAIELFSKGTRDYFYNDWIPFYAKNDKVSADEIKKMSKEKRVETYVDKIIKFGDSDILQDIKRAYSDSTYGEMLKHLSRTLGKDGLIYKHNEKTKVFVAWDADQIKILKS